ncbi:MAG: helix-turn-helix transcriptional regulator [Bacteroidota bacterium]
MPELPTWYTESWVATLARVVEETSQGRVAKALGYSRSTVSQILSGTYRADVAAVRQAVLDTFGTAAVACPTLGEITQALCAATRNLPFAATNPQRVRQWRACRVCALNPNREG